MYDPRLTREQLEFREAVRSFVEQEIKPAALERDRLDDFEARFPLDALREASKRGLRTLALSRPLGGRGADSLTCCLVLEELAVGDAGVAATLGQTFTFAHYWFDQAMTPEQRDRFLPDFLADDDYHLAYAGHEPDTDLGWDYFRPLAPASGYRTRAVRTAGGWVVNGTKNYITNGGIAKLFAVQARTDPSRVGPSGVSTLLVPRQTPGLTVREHDHVGRRLGSNAQLHFEDCFVPSQNLLGAEGQPIEAGATASWGRGDPRFQAINLGVGRAAYETALEFTRQRVQGGKPIIEHQAVGPDLAEMAILLEVARTMVWKAAWAADHPDAYSDGSLPDLPLQAMAKVFTAETVHRVTVTALKLFGGMGGLRELPLQKYVRDALVFLHSEHTNDVARLRLAETLAGYQRQRAANE
jgi:alkylation response protein AidB-like acyl-CoA dehydrogenase